MIVFVCVMVHRPPRYTLTDRRFPSTTRFRSWSVMTFLAGFAQNVWQLAITRIGLAIGEAGAIPSSHALVSLKFKPAQTGFLLSMLAIGGFGGMAAAPIIGGWAADTMGWRDRKSTRLNSSH